MSWSSDTIDKKGTNGLSEQDVHNIKVDYACGYGIEFIGVCRGFSTDQVSYAINLNEPNVIVFRL